MNKLSLILVSLGAYIGGIQLQGAQACTQIKLDSHLSLEETAAFQWFEKNGSLVGSVHKHLPAEDQEFFNKKIPYKDNPEAFKSATLSFASTFYKFAQEKNIEIPYSEDMLGSALLKIRVAMQNKTVEKPTDLISARMYVWSKLLTVEEQATVYRDNYLKNPEAAHQVIKKNGALLAEELAKLKIIEDTDVAKIQCAEEFRKKKIEDLQRQYCS